MQVTVSSIKADVGSIGGHTKPSQEMLDAVWMKVQDAKHQGVIIDGATFFTGDDINLVMSHTRGKLNTDVHLGVALAAFQEATAIAQKRGLYAAGQDLLVDAPSGNLKGAGPAVAEVTFDHDVRRTGTKRPAESFLVFAADKCGPGAYNLPLTLAFSDPMHCGGLLLAPEMHRGFRFQIIDLDQAEHDSIIELDAPEDLYRIAALLRDNERFAIDAIFSRAYPEQQAVAVSAQRLHNIAGVYTGKDDPVAIVRTQKFFPATEEAIGPWRIGHYVGGNARGSHVLSIMPVAVNSAVAGFYCLPIVSCVAFSMDAEGRFASEYVDIFADASWDAVRLRVQEKADAIRRQGYFGAAMLPYKELEYGGIKQILEQELLPRFHPR